MGRAHRLLILTSHTSLEAMMSVRTGARAVLTLRPKRTHHDGRVEFLAAELREPGRHHQDTWTAEEADALVLRMYARPSAGETGRVDAQARDIAGGYLELQDIQNAVEVTGAIVEAELVAMVWPEGRPQPANDDELAAQEASINAAFRTHRSEARAAHLDARELADRITFLAHHAVVHVRESTPAGWRRIHQLELSRDAIAALVDAWREAQEEHGRGNV